jgi:hypothetical protein
MNTLTNEQKFVVDCLLDGYNIFLSGGAGCGKSYLISTIYTEFPALKKLYIESQSAGLPKLPRIQLTALTGCASLLLGHKAKTLHSWAGVGLGKGTVQELFNKIRRNQKAMKNWLCTDLLVIDEISMMTGELFDKLNQLGKRIRPYKDKPFGGIQVLLVGDFYQLPPINKNKDEPLKFTFESDAWTELFGEGRNGKCIELTEIQRQKDEVFQRVLKESRVGELSRESCAILRKCQGRKWQDNLIRPTLLFPRRAEVDMINDSNLRALEGRRYTYDVKLVYDGKVPIGFDIQDEAFKKAMELFDTEAGYQRRLELCKDAQVMLIANVYPDEGLVNGSRGVVVGFCEATDLPIVQFLNGVKKTVGAHTWPIEDYDFVLRSQIPLRLAYSVTIHKCISSDTLLSIPNMGLVQIKDLETTNQINNSIFKPTNITVTGLCENKNIIELYKGNIEDGIKIKSSFGYEIVTSNRHPLLIFNKDDFTFEWKKSPEIAINDLIVIKKGAKVEGNYYPLKNIIFNKPYNKKISVPDYINEDFGYFLGLMLGDGSINDKTYRFDILGIDFDILDIYINILEKQFNIKVKRHERKGTLTKTDRIFFHSKQLVELLKYIGYNFQKADKKYIPNCILKSPLSVQKAVIQGLYDTDGGVSPHTINYTTTSEIMGKQVQQILLNIGINTSRHILKNEDIDNNWKCSYRLNISGKSALKFTNIIGFKCKRKQDMALKRFYEKDTLRANNKSQSFEIFNGNKLITNLRNEMRNGLKRIKSDKITTDGNKLLSSLIYNRQKLRCDSLNVIINEIDNISQYKTGKLLKFIYDNGILIDTINNISIVKDIQMYDIGVTPINSSGYLPDGHDFIANGFVNHNCQGATLDSALVDIGSGVFEFGQAYVALSRARSLDALYVYDFEPTAFRAHPRVKDFYSKLKDDNYLSNNREYVVDKLLTLYNDNNHNNDNKVIHGGVSEIIRKVQVTKLE